MAPRPNRVRTARSVVRRATAKPRPKARTRLDVGRRKVELLELGLTVFAARPYDEVSIDELARKAKISKGLLYHYFPTKRDFYIAALELAASRLLVETEVDASLAPLERLLTGLVAYLDFVARHKRAYVALMRGGIGSDPAVARVVERTREAFLARLLTGVLASGPSARHAMRGWVGFVEALALDWVLHEDVPRDDLVELAVGVLLELIRRTGVSVLPP
jgi:AcrR family transcriptional regulator